MPLHSSLGDRVRLVSKTTTTTTKKQRKTMKFELHSNCSLETNTSVIAELSMLYGNTVMPKG